MLLSPEQARHALSRVDPARLLAGWPVGLRDGALLALTAAGLSSAEIATLQASAITMAGGQVVVTVRRRGIPWSVTLPIDLGARLLAWLTECRLWGEAEPVFRGKRGPLDSTAVRQVLSRYRKRASRPAPRRRA